ncbi:hypothetical protein HW555_008515, partial [Spodoptera exigua]
SDIHLECRYRRCSCFDGRSSVASVDCRPAQSRAVEKGPTLVPLATSPIPPHKNMKILPLEVVSEADTELKHAPPDPTLCGTCYTTIYVVKRRVDLCLTQQAHGGALRFSLLTADPEVVVMLQRSTFTQPRHAMPRI